MKRYFQILGLVLLAFAAGGWGSVIATVLCPHAGSVAFRRGGPESVAAEQACHQVKPEPQAQPHCHESETEREATVAVRAEEEAAVLPPALLPPAGDSRALALPRNVPCTHCLSRPQVPAATVTAGKQAEQKRSFEPAALQAVTFAATAEPFAEPVAYRQGAPPGPQTPRHLLISILLI